MLKLLKQASLFVFASLMAVNGAHAAASDWSITDTSRVRIISQTDAVGDATQVTLGLHFKLKDHWKIYWRSPGDAGFPPSLEWAGSTNVEKATIEWPLPKRFSILSFETLGYTTEAVLPITVTLKDKGAPMNLKAQISYLACAEVCLPFDADLSLSLPGGVATPSAESQLINRFQVQVPRAGPSMGIALQDVQFKQDAQQPDLGTLFVTATSNATFKAPDLFVEGSDVLAFSAPKTLISADGKLTLMKVRVEGLNGLKIPFTKLPMILTVADRPKGAEFQGVIPKPITPEMAALSEKMPQKQIMKAPSLWVMLGLALLGGLILNLMPCVLPVLSIKLLGVVSHGGGSTRTVRLNFLASSAGIISSFLVLAGILIALKSAGVAIGWGIQFQHPWFLIAMAMIVTLFACNLWGFFEVQLPESVAEFGAQETHAKGLGKHFMTGAFATLLATPCSAPFLGTAVGFALARGSGEILMIFAMLGVGLAAPYIMISIYPKFATMMPKPGRWMIILRRVLGFALAATGVWLVTILAVQVNEVAAMFIAGLMVAIVIMLYVHKRLHRRYGRLDWGAVGVLALLAFAVPGTVTNGTDINQGIARLEGLWQTFDETKLHQYVNNGRVVFVDVTAKWCITCQVNKAVVLSKGEVFVRLNEPKIIAMQADWTRPSDVIANYLASFGRYGIPFNAVYGPGAPNGIMLPELLNQKVVLDAMDKAAKTHP